MRAEEEFSMQKSSTRAKNKYNREHYETVTIRFKKTDETYKLLEKFASYYGKSKNYVASKILKIYLNDAKDVLHF